MIILDEVTRVKEYKQLEIPYSEEIYSLLESKNYSNLFENLSIKSVNDKFYISMKTKFWIGLVKLGEHNIIIEPGFSNAKFIYMLKFIEPDVISVLDEIFEGISFDDSFFEVFLKNFLKNVLEVLLFSRKKKYVSKTSNLMIPDGKLLLAKTINHQINGGVGFWVNQRRFTFDNIHNQIIKFTLNFLYPTISTMLESNINEVLSLLNQITLLPLLDSRNIDGVLYDRSTYHYKKIHSICKLILDQNEVSLLEGTKTFRSFFFNAWDIFEKFVRTIIQNSLIEKYIVEKSVENTKNTSGLTLGNKFRNLPDILIYDNDMNLKLILDAKYKHDITKNDFNQAGNYIRKLMIDKNLPINNRNCILIYPSSINLENEERKLTIESKVDRNLKRGGSVYAYSIDLNQVDNEEYVEKWVNTIKDNFL